MAVDARFGSTPPKPKVAPWNDPVIRGWFFQIVVVGLFVLLAIYLVQNTMENLERQKIASGFGFLQKEAGFEIGDTIIPYSAADTYGRALLVGLINTLRVAVLGIIFATILGTLIGVGRLSSNWLLAKICEVYVEAFRNVPLLLWLLLIAKYIRESLPGPRQAWNFNRIFFSVDEKFPDLVFGTRLLWLVVALIIAGIGIWLLTLWTRSDPKAKSTSFVVTLVGLAGLTILALFVMPNIPFAAREHGFDIFLSNRGLYIPVPVLQALHLWMGVAFLIGIAGAWAIARWARKRQEATGQQFPRIWAGLGVIIGLPLIVWLLGGAPAELSIPELTGFNFSGGSVLQPEFIALLVGLVLYTSAFIAEIVRSGILAIHRGQTEAALAIGLTRGQTMRLVLLPQALRVIVPPMTSQYLNITKNSSLAIAIGYPDLVASVNVTINQTGQAIEGILFIMAAYLSVSLSISLFMNWYNKRIALVER